jgi:small-conductance mechanosensitive channel
MLAMPEFRAPRVRMPKVTLPGRAGGTTTKKATASKAKTKEQPKTGNGAKPAETKEATKPTAAKTAADTKAKSPDPNLQERMEGLQGWMAEIERKQGRMTYFGIAGVVIAILAAGAALYFGLTAKSDSATKGDLDGLTKRIDALEAAATKNSKDTQEALNSSVAQLQQSIAAIQKQQSQNAASISTLQSQASAGALGKGAAAGAGTALTPEATTTTTPAGK